MTFPFLYKAWKESFTGIAESQIGIVESIDGDPVPPGKIFPRAADNIKVTPDFLVQGGDNPGGLLSAFLTKTIAGSTEKG